MKENIIQILPEFIANQIAAGEVVQRPESVVKELIENSLDANATTIAIFIVEAGKNLIHIVDDGIGMSKENLELSILRHATSKIRTSQDLEEIKTFGFRGEAIPSISSVALLEIRSKQKNAEHGWKLISEPLKNFTVEPITMEIGTQIFVKNLFYNVPARRKFLKSQITEQKYIHETMQKFAIAHPNKRFIFYNNNTLVFDVKPETLNERIQSILRINAQFSDKNQLLEVNFEMNDIKIYGFVGQPQLARKFNPIQYFFLNGRSINSKNLAYSVYSAYEHLIEKNLKPFFILNIFLDYKTVDVNVHPQKSEVKFEDEKLISTCIKKSVNEALKLHNLTPNLINNSDFEYTKTEENGKEKTILVDKKTGEILDKNEFYNLKYENLVGKNLKNIKENSNSSSKYNENKKYNFQKYSEQKFPLNNSKTNINESINLLYSRNFDKKIEENELFDKEIFSENQLNNLWQFYNKYIFFQTVKGFIAIDQHNAHERIIYEKLIDKIKIGEISKQNLLFPVEIELNSMQLLTVKEISNELNKIGFSYNHKNNQEIEIFSQPSDLNFDSVENAFIEILENFIQNEELKLTNKYDKIIATVACKAAIKAGKKLSQEEMQNIVKNLFYCKMPHICPHGRPILIQFTVEEFDKKFGR